MRVLWLVRRNLMEHFGGDTVQIIRTAEALRAMGVDIDMHSDVPGDLSSYNLAHLFHLDRLWENAAHSKRLAARGLPMVLSTIYWPTEEFDREGQWGWQQRVSRLTGQGSYRSMWLMQRWAHAIVREGRWSQIAHPVWWFRKEVMALLRHVSMILPNSHAELEAIERKFGGTGASSNVEGNREPRYGGPGPPVLRSVIVPNAVDEAALGTREDVPFEQRRGVLCVGRIEPRKNQLNLIRALRDSDIPLTLVGQVGSFNRAYARQCRREATSNIRFLDRQPADALGRLYGRHAVHACVSWYETPGLVHLEAACCGCALVATPGGCTREYLGDEAEYADPRDPVSIRRTIQAAMNRGPSEVLAERIRREFTWDMAARRTLEAYEAVSGVRC